MSRLLSHRLPGPGLSRRLGRRRGRSTSLCVITIVALITAVLLNTGSAMASNPSWPKGFTISGLDLHDGSMYESDGTYYLAGTEYACGFQWESNSPFCGFGVSTATSRTGPWSAPTLLFPPSEVDPYTHRTFNGLCSAATHGLGCFNPRMVRRASDGVWLLWFNAVAAQTGPRNSAYYVMGCNGPAGPCGRDAGAPHGSTHRPALHQCNGNDGDFTIATAGTLAALVCGDSNHLSEESLDSFWANGTGIGATDLAGLSHVEAPGVYQDPASGTWVLTYSDPNCGYCSGTGTGYATAPGMLGPWQAPGDVGWAAPQAGRRDISATSCGGQPRTVSVVDQQAWQGIDLWTGTRNEAHAGLRYEPLVFLAPGGHAGDGGTWEPFRHWSCH